jgi:uncharacterized membrane protein YccF (DUF307 family)
VSEFAAGAPPETREDLPTSPGALEPTTSRAGTDIAAPASSAAATINQNIIVSQRKHGPGLFVRSIWYLFVGWWLTGLAIGFAWLCALSVVLLPVAYLVVSKLPTILTLRPRSIGTDVSLDADGTIRITTGGAAQKPIWMRALWFLFVGWWACGLAMAAAYLLCLTIILLPVGLMIFNRVPAVMTLQRN